MRLQQLYQDFAHFMYPSRQNNSTKKILASLALAIACFSPWGISANPPAPLCTHGKNCLAPILSPNKISKAQLAGGKFTPTTSNYLNKLDYYEDLLANFPLAFHVKCWSKQAAMIEKTFKSLTVKIEVNAASYPDEYCFVVGTVNWLSTGPLGLKKINDSLGWATADKTRDWIWAKILEQIEEKFNAPGTSVLSPQVVTARLTKISRNVIDEFYTRLAADENFLGLSAQARALFLNNREVFENTLQCSVSFPLPVPQNDEQQKLKRLLDLQNFATALSRTSQPQQKFFTQQSDPLLALYEVVTDPQAAPEQLAQDDIEKTRKDDFYIQRKYADKAYPYQAGLDIIKIFGRPQNQSIQMMQAYNRAMEAIEKHEYLKNIKDSINNRNSGQNQKERRNNHLRFFTRFLKKDPRHVSIEFLQSQADIYPELKHQLEPLLLFFTSNKPKPTPVLSKQYYDDLFYQAYRTPALVRTQLAMNLKNAMAPAKVFGDEYFMLNVNADDTITEVFTDLKGLGLKNLQDIRKLVSMVRQIDRELAKAQNATELAGVLAHLSGEYAHTPFGVVLQQQYNLCATRILNKQPAAWQSFVQATKKNLAIKLLEKAEYGVTLQLRLGEYQLLHSMLTTRIPELRLQRFIDEAINVGRRVVVTTVDKPKDMRADDFRAALSQLQEHGADLSKKLEALGLTDFYLTYKGSLEQGHWTFFNQKNQITITDIDKFYEQKLSLHTPENNISTAA